MIKIAICDDESIFLENEINIISRCMNRICDFEYSIDTYKSGKEFVEKNQGDIAYDIIFLDINMDDMDGLEIARYIRDKSDKVQLVFVTGFITYALEGYKVNAIRYILKDEKTLEKAIEECMEIMIKQIKCSQRTISLSFKDGNRNVKVNDIIYIESNLHYLIFHLNNASVPQITMHEKLDNIDDMLAEYSFCRIHKSYLVNLEYVDNIERYQVKMKDGIVLNIAKPRYPEVRKQYICYEGKI